jgi:hypothetical protein
MYTGLLGGGHPATMRVRRAAEGEVLRRRQCVEAAPRELGHEAGAHREDWYGGHTFADLGGVQAIPELVQRIMTVFFIFVYYIV